MMVSRYLYFPFLNKTATVDLAPVMRRITSSLTDRVSAMIRQTGFRFCWCLSLVRFCFPLFPNPKPFGQVPWLGRGANRRRQRIRGVWSKMSLSIQGYNCNWGHQRKNVETKRTDFYQSSPTVWNYDTANPHEFPGKLRDKRTKLRTLTRFQEKIFRWICCVCI